jgi:hypothetical protein
VTDRVNRGEQVLAVDLPFRGAAWAKESTWLFGQMLYTLGERPLGVEASHLLALGRMDETEWRATRPSGDQWHA